MSASHLFENPGFENLRSEKRNQIAFLTIARPKVLNALNAATMQELTQAFQAVQEDDDVRAVILTGEGDKSFVAGADITELASLDATAAAGLATRGQALFSLIEDLGKPVIAAVNGFALGAGCELALACSIRLAAGTARFSQPETKLGLIPGYGGTQRLPRLIGKGRALEILLTGEMIDAAEALRVGLVNQVVPADQLLPRAEAVAAKIIANGPLAIRYCLQAVNRGMEMPLAEAMAHEAALFALCCATQDKTEGTRAFLEKRAPQFKGL
jgi:enoyl-CoA hydratase/carnithine racemase